MIIRPGQLSDKGRVLVMLKVAHAAAEFPFPFSAPYASLLFDRHIGGGDNWCVILEVDGKAKGCLLATAQNHPFGPVRFASEVVWWIDPDVRGGAAARAMLEENERIAADHNCEFVTMVALASADRAGLIYKRSGYMPIESTFYKRIV